MKGYLFVYNQKIKLKLQKVFLFGYHKPYLNIKSKSFAHFIEGHCNTLPLYTGGMFQDPLYMHMCDKDEFINQAQQDFNNYY